MKYKHNRNINHDVLGFDLNLEFNILKFDSAI